MNKLKLYPKIIYRIPQFSIAEILEAAWPELKACITSSSTEFYNFIHDIDHISQLDGANEKVKATLWKYFNRARFRPTPFGEFSACGVLDTGLHPGAKYLIVENHQHLHSYPDWTEKDNINIDFQALLAEGETKLFSNTSYYFTQNSIRYISKPESAFELTDLDRYPIAEAILEKCKVPQAIKNLRLAFSEIPQEDLNGLITDMVSLELLLLETSPNIIGEEYFQRIGHNSASKATRYLLSERKVVEGNIDLTLLKHLPNALTALNSLLPVIPKPALESFVNRFRALYDQQQVPLLQILDPETGIGYGELEQSATIDNFASQFASPREKTLNDAIQEEIRPKVFNELEKQVPIQLDGLFDQHQDAVPELKFPNSFTVMGHLCDGMFILEHMGGATSNALNGRFTLASEEIHQATTEMAELEQNANPDVLFFDMAYMGEGRVDNVNRRKQIYPYQLSLLNYDLTESPIALNDLYLHLHGDQLILRSKTLNKRLIPRLASAYNYTRSDLSAFRLLCDLQDQAIRTSLVLPLDTLLANQSRYPRLTYRNIVLSPARWKLGYKNLENQFKTPSIEQTRTYLKETGIPRYFKAGVADQTLFFDIEGEQDMEVFLQLLQLRKNLDIEEGFLPKAPHIIDENQKPYIGQLVVSLCHNEQLYSDIRPAIEHQSTEQVTGHPARTIPMGKDWLYFELYCHPHRSDYILNHYISPFLYQYQDKISHWFFIRYTENGNHIRLRLRLNDQKDGQLLIAAFSELLEQELYSGGLSELLLKTYRRELERYGPELIEQVEEHFCTDSSYVLTLLENPLGPNQCYDICKKLIWTIREREIFDGDILTGLIKRSGSAFENEHQLDAQGYKKLNQQYQLCRNEEPYEFTDVQKQAFETFQTSLCNLLKSATSERKGQLLGDLIHMHLNRLFAQHQRSHEMIFYYFLQKDFQREKALAARPVTSPR
jgi:thiopeptide-type bacteriocin biosynthesis protein